ncbi:sigma-70 family RNA polymerase sigma factor [Pseudoflavonifractor sp. MCC625]|uniref:RNA polymerase sigma factor n=1 Tax=Pseudoflavonifractor sp. MCC625 TaxID=2592647 RepID=UPI001C026CD0|nr:sigma-70 family RNA polymerase sigma factor [Pseudoflavonifractor sp. MCC625]MBT9685201.1 sigma-70 family RNA polymerase sigma factor [Pseudoflavonifractor sp. MCC625]
MRPLQGEPRAGERERFGTLVMEHSRSMFRAARAILDSDADAEDAVGEAVLLAWRSFTALRRPEAARAWLLKITVNCARSQRRRQRRVIYMEDLGERSGPWEEPVDTLWDAVGRLPETHRIIVTLFYYEDMTIAQIAQLLHLPQGTVKSRLSRAREKLRILLEEEGQI